MSKMNQFAMALDEYAEFLKTDYNKRSYSSTLNRELVVEFEPGSKFIKVIISHSTDGVRDGHRSSHSFIVINECKTTKTTFRHGDILKSASWRAPAKNFARGNVMDGAYGTISWAGA